MTDQHEGKCQARSKEDNEDGREAEPVLDLEGQILWKEWDYCNGLHAMTIAMERENKHITEFVLLLTVKNMFKMDNKNNNWLHLFPCQN